MAGGYGKGAGIPLQDRLRSDQIIEVDPGPGRHVWVSDPSDGSGSRRPGLLVEWRRGAGESWEGRVVYVAQLRVACWVTIEEWVPAALLEPA